MSDYMRDGQYLEIGNITLIPWFKMLMNIDHKCDHCLTSSIFGEQ